MASHTDKTALPEAARSNPYSLASREALDAAYAAVTAQLAKAGDAESSRRAKLEVKERQILDGYLWLMVRQGLAEWDGGKPSGSNPPIEITPGPPISDYVIEDRR